MYRKEDIKFSFFEDDCLCTKSERLDKNNFGTSKQSKDERFKVNIKMLVAFLYTKNDQVNLKLKPQCHLNLHTQTRKTSYESSKLCKISTCEKVQSITK